MICNLFHIDYYIKSNSKNKTKPLLSTILFIVAVLCFFCPIKVHCTMTQIHAHIYRLVIVSSSSSENSSKLQQIQHFFFFSFLCYHCISQNVSTLTASNPMCYVDFPSRSMACLFMWQVCALLEVERKFLWLLVYYIWMSNQLAFASLNIY